jgi:hypothetical protein
MKNFREYINIASTEYANSDMKLNSLPIPVEQIYQIAMQLSKQDADRELAAQRHAHNVEIEQLRTRLKHFTPASEASQKYLSQLQNTDEKKLIVVNYVQKKNTTVPALNQSEVSELIDMLKAVKNEA